MPLTQGFSSTEASMGHSYPLARLLGCLYSGDEPLCYGRLISSSNACFLLQIFRLFHQHYVVIKTSSSVRRAEKITF